MRTLDDWGKYRAHFGDGTTREFIARHFREAQDRAENYAGTRTLEKVECLRSPA